MADSLQELIERLEAASEGSRELDARISAATGGVVAEGLADADYAWFAETYEYRDHEDCLQETDNATQMGVPRYTASIDAALTLVPEGWRFAVTDLRGGDPETWDESASSAVVATQQTEERADGASPALALCVAALRARTALSKDSSDGR